MELHLHSPYAFMAWWLVKHREDFTFTFTFTYKEMAEGYHTELLFHFARAMKRAQD
jgi:hypothetical protein